MEGRDLKESQQQTLAWTDEVKEEGCFLMERSQLMASLQVGKELSLGFILEIRNPNPSYQAWEQPKLRPITFAAK